MKNINLGNMLLLISLGVALLFLIVKTIQYNDNYDKNKLLEKNYEELVKENKNLNQKNKDLNQRIDNLNKEYNKLKEQRKEQQENIVIKDKLIENLKKNEKNIINHNADSDSIHKFLSEYKFQPFFQSGK